MIKWLIDLQAVRKGREHDRDMRLFDSATEAAVTFLAACDRVTRWSRRISVVVNNLNRIAPTAKDDNPIWRLNQDSHQRMEEQREEADQEADRALTALYLLLPETGKVAFAYLEACRKAVEGDDPNRQERHRLRRESEAVLRVQLRRGTLRPGLPCAPSPRRAPHLRQGWVLVTSRGRRHDRTLFD